MFKKMVLFSAGILSSISLIAHAQVDDPKHVVVAPQCLLDKTSVNYSTLSSINNFSLIKIDEANIEALIAAKHKRNTQEPCGGFMDVTEAWKEFILKSKISPNKEKSFLLKYIKKPTPSSHSIAPQAYTIRYQNEVNTLLKLMNPENMWKDLTVLTTYPDRYSRSDNGVKAANWIKTQVETIAKTTGHDDVTVYYVLTGSYKQPSVVAKIGNSTEPGVVIGGHMDTLSSYWENKPGADDDGTGTVTVLEVARTILSSGMHFKKPIYLIWYAAEEVGLVGSSFVVSDFKAKKIPVSAVMQLDMTGYAYKNDPTMWLISDYTNRDLTLFLENLIKTYVKQTVKYTRCGYACSDHASWHQNGFIASFPFEASFSTDNPTIHTVRDTMNNLSLSHMSDYTKLAIAFAVELAEPVA